MIRRLPLAAAAAACLALASCVSQPVESTPRPDPPPVESQPEPTPEPETETEPAPVPFAMPDCETLIPVERVREWSGTPEMRLLEDEADKQRFFDYDFRELEPVAAETLLGAEQMLHCTWARHGSDYNRDDNRRGTR